MSYIGNEPIVSATRTITEVTAIAGQTVFTANGGYTVGYIDVFLNGAQLQTVDFTATNGTTITLTEAAQVGDVIRLVAWGTFSTNSIQGNLDFTGTAARIRGDMSNATALNRVAFQTSTTNSQTAVLAIPNGTSGTAQWQAYNNSDTTNSSFLGLAAVGSTDTRITSGIVGTGTYLPLTMYTGGSERMRIDTSGRVTMPSQPRFSAGIFSSTSVSNNSVVLFGTSYNHNPTSSYNSSNGRFTAPVTGFYQFNTVVRFDNNPNTGSYARVRPFVNGAHIEGTVGDAIYGSYTSNQAYAHVQTSFAVLLTANDYIEIRADNGTGATITVVSAGFSGFLVA